MLAIVLSGFFALAQCAPQTDVHAAVDQRAGSQNFVRDLGTLQSLAKAVTGPSVIKTDWTKAGANVCHWGGVTCDKTSVWGIDFNNFGLTGNLRLDGFIDKLPDLKLFHVNSNGFTGTVPNLSKQKNLKELDLGNNKLSGPFPANVFTAPGITFLDLRFNNFNGKLPSNVFNFKKLDVLFLNNNQFTGSLPSTIGSFIGSLLVVANNKFTGSIPSNLADARNLQQVLLLGNKLTGSLPAGLGKLSNLKVFDASDNQLSGTVPEDLCSNKGIEAIVLTGNKFDKALGKECTKAKNAGILEI